VQAGRNRELFVTSDSGSNNGSQPETHTKSRLLEYYEEKRNPTVSICPYGL